MRGNQIKVMLAAMIAGGAWVGVAGQAEAGDRIVNGKYNTVVNFGLAAQSGADVHKRQYEFSVVDTGDLHFAVGCEDQSEMTVSLEASTGEHFRKKVVGAASHKGVESALFTFTVKKEHLAATRWQVEVASKWAMPVCRLDLYHDGRVSMFRSTARDADTYSRRTQERDLDPWANTPFVLFIEPRRDDDKS